MTITSKDYYDAKQQHERETHEKLLEDLKATCNEFPVEELSSEDIRGSSLYSHDKTDFYFSIDAHKTFTDIARTLRYFPVDQKDLRIWRYIVDEVYRYINYDTFPVDHTQFITEFLNLERIIRGVHIVNLFGTDPSMTLEKASKALHLTTDRLSILVPRVYFERGSNQHVNSTYGLDTEIVSALKSKPLHYTLENFNFGEGEFFTPTFLYILRTIAKRRSQRTVNAIKNEERLTIKDLRSLTWGIEPVIKMVDRDSLLLHVFPAYDNMLSKEITREEYLDIYGL